MTFTTPMTSGLRSESSNLPHRSFTPRALELGAEASEIGRSLEVPDLEMLGLALQGATLVAGAQVDRGMRCLDEAAVTALAGEATIPISGAWVCCFLVSACTAVLDYERAVEWCDRIAAFAERYGSRYMLAFCRANYGAIDMWRGRWSDAEGTDPQRRNLADEAIWLGRLLTHLLPDEPEPLGLLALMLHAQARRPARRDAAGSYVPLARQDPSRSRTATPSSPRTTSRHRADVPSRTSGRTRRACRHR